MIDGEYNGMDRNHPEFRKMFTLDHVMNSDWYKERLKLKQQKDIQYWTDNIAYLEKILKMKNYKEAIERLNLVEKLEDSKKQLAKVSNPDYLEELVGTIGADPLTA